MAVLVLTSCSGSPGVTTLAVGLALTWPRPVLLVDADPGAPQAVLAGYLTGRSAGGKGLLRVAEAHRDRRDLREAVVDQCLTLAETDGDRRLFLPGFTRPGSAGHFAGVWDDLADTFDRLGDVDLDVVVDAGRLGPLGLPPALLERSALTVVLLGSSLRAVLAARVQLPVLAEAQRAGHGARGRTGLVVVDEGHPYRAAEIGRALGVEVVARLPHDPSSAAHFSDGAPQHRKFAAAPLVTALRSTASTFAGVLQQSTALVRS
ncbi:hypothetical protein SAMN04488543_4251 [Friedmanniella luteola]|uniref:MinD-like ATPase involved in chromosome partitioning or flagellar assembly n=1 Tax=Friedmanniella luteola TaxID=546871 RepID=A0A1H2A6X8_9ACTN|nr:hypothetical protein [Friedmanniella luteola]SDT41532.1 hypothetical protein SAMN04488543_4251 [Friedmanniella luteola]